MISPILVKVSLLHQWLVGYQVYVIAGMKFPFLLFLHKRFNQEATTVRVLSCMSLPTEQPDVLETLFV